MRAWPLVMLSGCGPTTAEGIWVGSCDIAYATLVAGEPVEVLLDYGFRLDVTVERDGRATAIEAQLDDVEEPFIGQLVGQWVAPALTLVGEPEQYDLVLSSDGDVLTGEWTLDQPNLAGTGTCVLDRE